MVIHYKNSAEVDIAPALGKITAARNEGQGHRVIVRMLEEYDLRHYQ